MKYSLLFAAVAAVATAQIPPDQLAADNAAVVPPEQVSERVRPIAIALADVRTGVIDLDTTIQGFQGAAQIATVNDSVNSVLSTIADQSNQLAPLPQLNFDDDFGDILKVVPSVISLGDYVNITAYDIITRKQLFVDACVGPLVLQQANNLNVSSSDFIDLVNSKLPEAVQSSVPAFVAPIRVALNSAVSAFADQTTLPASCSPTSTTTTTTSTSTSTSTSIASGAYGAPTGWATWSAQSSSYPTGGKGKCYRRRHRHRRAAQM